jgi:hypothetical protein
MGINPHRFPTDAIATASPITAAAIKRAAGGAKKKKARKKRSSLYGIHLHGGPGLAEQIRHIKRQILYAEARGPAGFASEEIYDSAIAGLERQLVPLLERQIRREIGAHHLDRAKTYRDEIAELIQAPPGAAEDSSSSAAAQARAELLAEQNRGLRKTLAFYEKTRSTFAGFREAQRLGLPYLGPLASGIPSVPRDSFAFLHRGEAVLPEESNPFRGGGRASGSAPSIEIRMTESLAAFTDRVEQVTRGQIEEISDSVNLRSGRTAQLSARTPYRSVRY